MPLCFSMKHGSLTTHYALTFILIIHLSSTLAAVQNICIDLPPPDFAAAAPAAAPNSGKPSTLTKKKNVDVFAGFQFPSKAVRPSSTQVRDNRATGGYDDFCTMGVGRVSVNGHFNVREICPKRSNFLHMIA